MKSLHQRPRSRLVPLPDYVAEFCATASFANGELVDVLLKAVRERTQLAVQRNDFKFDTLQRHLFMNFRVVDEHGRQLAMGRHLPTLKAEWGRQARSAFQALASLKLVPQRAEETARRRPAQDSGRIERRCCAGAAPCRSGCERSVGAAHHLDLRRTARS